MSRRALAVTLGVFVLLFGVLTPGRSAPVHGASLAKKTCKFVKKHGKHTKVCHTVTPEKLVGTPTPVPLPFNLAPVTRQCSATTDQTGCADLGFALSPSTIGSESGTGRALAGFIRELPLRAFRGVIGPSSRSGGSSYERPVGGLCPVRRGAPLPGRHGSWPPRAEAPAL